MFNYQRTASVDIFRNVLWGDENILFDRRIPPSPLPTALSYLNWVLVLLEHPRVASVLDIWTTVAIIVCIDIFVANLCSVVCKVCWIIINKFVLLLCVCLYAQVLNLKCFWHRDINSISAPYIYIYLGGRSQRAVTECSDTKCRF